MYRTPRAVHFMNLAVEHAKRSTCFRLNVGCLIAHNKDIIALTHNGPPRGSPHCAGAACEGASSGCTRSTHAEINALDSLSEGMRMWSFDVFVTHSPCVECISQLDRAGCFRRVFFQTEFRDTSRLEWLASRDTEVYKITPSGYITKFPTLQLIDPASLYP